MSLHPITKEAWAQVHQKACDVASAGLRHDDIMSAVHKEGM
ncbi:MAG: hypothetical protein JWO08_4044 [Verrucomicrobiaceae bacterium]|nr:hypothetical protein [Verrucomicrobiaceae bacterium]